MLLENVKGLTAKRYSHTLKRMIEELNNIGYYTHYKVLNSRNYGTPQKRERLFFACFLDKEEYNKFNWPIETGLLFPGIRLIENGVMDHEESLCLAATYFKGNTLQGYLEKTQRQIIYGDSIIVPNATKLGYKFAELGDFVLIDNPYSKTNRGRVQKEVLQTLTTSGKIAVVKKNEKYGIYFRLLTGKECFRFMGFFNDEINLEGISEAQRRKLAGNGWDINLISKIFGEMFKNEI